MPVTDWRSWTDQSGGTMPPGTPPAAGTFPVAFPGVNPISDLVNPATSYPPYPSLSNPGNFATVNAIDPFYVGTYPTGAGWMCKMGDAWYNTAGTLTFWPSGTPGASVPAGPIMRPVVAGVTS